MAPTRYGITRPSLAIQRLVRICLTAPLRILRITGDSMMPTLNDGDTILVDMGRKSPYPPGLFVLHDGMGLMAKRIEHIPSSEPPRISVTSDNPNYSPYECLLDEVNIVGRIRWYGRVV